MRNKLIYDLPTRMFHWSFAGLFIAAFLIAKTVDDDDLTYTYHMLAGLLLGFVVLLRIFWGTIGTKHAKFSSFALHPKELGAYFIGMFSGDKQKWAGHNPASSWTAVIMFGLAIGLGLTGYLMTSGQKEKFEDIHELFANGFLIAVLLHIAGVILHSLRHRDGIAMSMIDGSKKEVPIDETISNSRPLVALLFVGAMIMFAGYLVINFDSQKRELKFFGKSLELGEANEKDHSHKD